MVYPHEEPEETPEGSMATYLGCLDVMLGKPQERFLLARRVVCHGFTISDIKALERIVKNRKNPGDAIEKELKDLDQARIRIDDVRKCEAAKQSIAPGASETHQVDENCNQRKAYALVRVDHNSPEHVADLMGVSVTKVNEWCEQERDLRYGDMPPARKKMEEDNRTGAERLRDFKEFLAAKKAEKSPPTYTPKIVTDE